MLHKLCFPICIILTSCHNQSSEIAENTLHDALPVSINVRSSSITTDEQYYPISLFIFSENGKHISTHEITADEKHFSTKLKAGKYHLSAFSGLNTPSYTYPTSPSHNDIIGIKDSYSFTTPLMAGHHYISLSQSSDLSIPVRYCVSAINFSISDIPSDATSVSLGISPVSNGYRFDGTYSDITSSAEVTCTNHDGTWKAGPVYVFPSNDKNVLLTVSVLRGTQTETYTYTYPNSLQPSQPYNFIGKYKEGLTIDTSFEIEGWLPSLDIEYDLTGENSSEDDKPQETPDTDDSEIPTIYSDYLPANNTIWRSFYVWTTSAISSSEVEAVIIAPKQMFDIKAADAPDILATYEKEGLKNWRTFTEDEVRKFRKEFDEDAMGALNKYIYENGHDRYYMYNGERYLCRDAKYSFTFFGDTRITPVGEKTLYYLRPVKTVKIRIQ